MFKKRKLNWKNKFVIQNLPGYEYNGLLKQNYTTILLLFLNKFNRKQPKKSQQSLIFHQIKLTIIK